MTTYYETKAIREKALIARKALWSLIKQIHDDAGPTGTGLGLNATLTWLKVLCEGGYIDDGCDDEVRPPEKEVQ